MQRMIALLGIAATLLGSAPAFAQSQSNSSPAALLGVQERSIQSNFRSERVSTSTQTQPANGTVDKQLLLYQVDRNTRVVVGPARTNTQYGEFSGTSSIGDNRLQLLRDLDE